MNDGFITSDPKVGARKPKETGFKVNANGIPLDIIAKQNENKQNSDDAMMNDPLFAEMFGHVGTEIKDPLSEGGNEDHWISGSGSINTPTPPQPAKKTVQAKEEIPIDQMMIPTSDPNDISNDPKLKELLGSMKEDKESDVSDSHTMK